MSKSTGTVKATYLFPNRNVATFGWDDQQIPELQGKYTKELEQAIEARSTGNTSWNGFHENIRMEPRRPPVDPDATVQAQISLEQYVRMGGQIKEGQLVWSPVGGGGIYKLKQVTNNTAVVEDVTGKTAFMAVEWFMIVVQLPITTIASAEPAFDKPTRAFSHNAGKR